MSSGGEEKVRSFFSQQKQFFYEYLHFRRKKMWITDDKTCESNCSINGRDSSDDQSWISTCIKKIDNSKKESDFSLKWDFIR